MVYFATGAAPAGKTPIPSKRVAKIVRLTQAPLPYEATHWTVRAMAKLVGVAASTVQAIRKAHGLSPHRWRSFKPSPRQSPSSFASLSGKR
jgi:hypothetical protein